MYLEGSDQHRGWFQSSLLIGLGTRGRAPYRSVLTHGFFIDEDGRKMSKSLGNVVAPQEIISHGGAEILRLWVAMADYREEMRISKEILARVVEAYRKIRNTFRNCSRTCRLRSGATPRRPTECWTSTGSCWRVFPGSPTTCADITRGYDFQAAIQAITEFVTVHLSAFYLDVSKDRLHLPRRRRRASVRADRAIRAGRRAVPAAGTDPLGDDR